MNVSILLSDLLFSSYVLLTILFISLSNYLPGSYECSCNEGYYGSGVTCSDVDECANSPCGDNATCNNTPGGHTCTCDEGYSGDGINCADNNECDASPCDSNATCNNLPGFLFNRFCFFFVHCTLSSLYIVHF